MLLFADVDVEIFDGGDYCFKRELAQAEVDYLCARDSWAGAFWYLLYLKSHEGIASDEIAQEEIDFERRSRDKTVAQERLENLQDQAEERGIEFADIAF